MRCVQPLALQSEAEPCCGLIPLCHTLHCDPSVSVTLPALQQEKGNGGASVKKKTRSGMISVLPPLVFCHWVELQNLIIWKE